MLQASKGSWQNTYGGPGIVALADSKRWNKPGQQVVVLVVVMALETDHPIEKWFSSCGFDLVHDPRMLGEYVAL